MFDLDGGWGRGRVKMKLREISSLIGGKEVNEDWCSSQGLQVRITVLGDIVGWIGGALCMVKGGIEFEIIWGKGWQLRGRAASGKAGSLKPLWKLSLFV